MEQEKQRTPRLFTGTSSVIYLQIKFLYKRIMTLLFNCFFCQCYRNLTFYN